MAEAKQRAAWTRAGLIAALIYNVNRKKGAPSKTPDHFNPFAETFGRRVTGGIPLRAENIHLLKMFVKKKNQQCLTPPCS